MLFIHSSQPNTDITVKFYIMLLQLLLMLAAEPDVMRKKVCLLLSHLYVKIIIMCTYILVIIYMYIIPCLFMHLDRCTAHPHIKEYVMNLSKKFVLEVGHFTLPCAKIKQLDMTDTVRRL